MPYTLQYPRFVSQLPYHLIHFHSIDILEKPPLKDNRDNYLGKILLHNTPNHCNQFLFTDIYFYKRKRSTEQKTQSHQWRGVQKKVTTQTDLVLVLYAENLNLIN